MRIDAYNQIAQVYGTQNNVRTTKAKAAAEQRDQISISQAGRDYQVAKNAVSEASDIREDRISQIKAMIDAGTYSVDVGNFAGKLMQKYDALI